MTENTRRLSRNIKDKASSVKKWVEELTKDADSVLGLVKEKDETIQKLENSSKSLLKTNEDLRKKVMDKPSKTYQFPKKRSIDTRRKSLFKISETDLESERVIACEFSDIDEDNMESMVSQRNMSQDMGGQVSKVVSQIILPVQKEMTEIAETLPEGDEKEAMEELLLRSKQARIFNCFWKPLKLWLAAVLCFGLCIGLILLYAHFFNKNFIENILSLLFSDHSIAELTQFFSQHLTWKNNGLLPF